MAKRLPKDPRLQIILLMVLAVLVVVYLFREFDFTPEPYAEGEPGTYLFCFWNVENLFDDQLDGRPSTVDAEYDKQFAGDSKLLEQKLANISGALIELNDGKGPDILALAEVESVSAAKLLQQALNARLGDRAPPYREPLMLEVAVGRHIAPAILTRLPVTRDRTQQLDKRLRILEGHLHVAGQPLEIIVSHWTSRVSDEKGTGRKKYADLIYGRYKAMYLSNPQVDLLICGDFNDAPEDESVVQHLHATGDRMTVLHSSADRPLLFNLFAGKDPKRFGTLYYRGWDIFDQIVVSPGMLDDTGWTCLVDSVHTVNTLFDPDDSRGRPWSFEKSNPRGQRGYSDHFPVTVRLRVQGKNAEQK
jgi:endonuclease/exonuclease/phosphatase family metal-dependent hydrolase